MTENRTNLPGMQRHDSPKPPVDPSGLTDHFWSGDDDGHNCFTCQERDDSLFMCWPQAHPCAICEKVPLDWPDMMCAPCRRRVDRSLDTVVDPVELVLTTHQHVCSLSDIDGTMCACTEHFEGGPGFWRRHVAEKVYEALGIEGPKPWVLGPDSPNRERAGFERFPVAPDFDEIRAHGTED